MINILLITNELKQVCGVSNHIKSLVNGFYEHYTDFKYIILCGKIESGELIKQYNCEVLTHDVILHSNRSILSLFRAVLLVKNIIKKYEINIIHTHNHYAANISYYSSIFTKVKTIQANHGIINEVGRLKHFHADYYVVLSDRIKNHLIKSSKINPANIITIKQGISEEKLMQQDKPKNNKLIIFSASRFVEEKAMELFIRASHSLSSRYNSISEFYVSGEGPEKNYLIRLNESLGGVVRFVDPIRDYKNLLSCAHIFVFTSLTEGVPIVVLEAIDNNCLVVSSAYNGYKDIFSDDYSSLIFEQNNISDLIDKLNYAINNYSSLLDYYQPYYNIIRLNHSVLNMLDRHHELYIKLKNFSNNKINTALT